MTYFSPSIFFNSTPLEVTPFISNTFFNTVIITIITEITIVISNIPYNPKPCNNKKLFLENKKR